MSAEHDAYVGRIRDLIEDQGWIVQGVLADTDRPHFHYTVGLWPNVGFEIIAMGLPFDTGTVILNDLARRVIAGERFTHGQVLSDVLAGYDVTMIEIPVTGDYMGVANRLYRLDGVNIPAWQMVYPDAEHRWPWDPTSALADIIPVFGSAPPERPNDTEGIR